MSHDLSFHSGERQTASAYGDVRADHRYRYEWAERFIPQETFGLDLFCGNGYGSWLLGATRNVFGLDGSLEAVNFATQHFGSPKTRFAHAYWPFDLPMGAFDFIVSLESIEHVPDGEALFQKMVDALKPGGLLIYSTPNEDLLPHASTGNHFHFRHYTLEQTLALAQSKGTELLGWAGQNTYEMTEDGMQGGLLADDAMILRDHVAGQFCVVACRKPDATSDASVIRPARRGAFWNPAHWFQR